MTRIRYQIIPWRLYAFALVWLLAGCATDSGQTIASLKNVEIDISDVPIEGGLEKAMEGYRKFLEETPETAMTPEAIRRLADLKIEKGNLEADAPFIELENTAPAQADISRASPGAGAGSDALAIPGMAPVTSGPALSSGASSSGDNLSKSGAIANIAGESEEEFTRRIEKEKSGQALSKQSNKLTDPKSGEQLQSANAKEAIELYKGLLAKYPLYDRNDQVLYQLSRAYEENGQIEVAIKSLDQLIAKYPTSRHIDEAQFRRGEHFFSRKRFLDAEDAYKAVVDIGQSSAFYELSMYKRGWSYFKQELYEEALGDFIGMLDIKVAQGYDFDQASNKAEKKRVDDTYRVISLSFSYLGGANSVVEFFGKVGSRTYEVNIYSHLGEYYLDKRRYSDAALAYNTFIERNPLNKVAPNFNVRVIEIYTKGGFPKLVIDAKKQFSNTYALRANYWSYFDIKEFPEIHDYLKSNLIDLAQHYHALYQDKRLRKKKAENYTEAIQWYRTYLESFATEPKAADMNYQLAGLMLENKDFRGAALEYERTAYDYPKHATSSEAGYASVFAYREYMKVGTQAERGVVRREVIRSSLKFAENFPEHKNAAIILSAAADDLYALKDYELAIKTGQGLLKNFPNAEKKLQRSAWLVIAHSSFDLTNYVEAEQGYKKVISLTEGADSSHAKISDNLAASIYKQGEQARKLEDHKTAANHFLRLGKIVPTASIRATAEYDAAAALIVLKDWPAAIGVLENFRTTFPKHELQADVTKKLAVVYKEADKPLLAAAQFERIAKESKDDEVRREALIQAAELYEKSNDENRALAVYKRYIAAFSQPIDMVLEVRQKMADVFKSRGRNNEYIAQLKKIVSIDRTAGAARTDRTRYLAANASLLLAQPVLDQFTSVKLVKPFKTNLNKKKKRMKVAIDTYTKLIDFEVAEATSGATFYLAEIYFHFSRSLMESERPGNLNADELEQYELVLEEQAYPFEEKAIKVHEKNMELLNAGIYNPWIDKSIEKLATLVPARYAKKEESSDYLETIYSRGTMKSKASPKQAQNFPEKMDSKL